REEDEQREQADVPEDLFDERAEDPEPVHVEDDVHGVAVRQSAREETPWLAVKRARRHHEAVDVPLAALGRDGDRDGHEADAAGDGVRGEEGGGRGTAHRAAGLYAMWEGRGSLLRAAESDGIARGLEPRVEAGGRSPSRHRITPP